MDKFKMVELDEFDCLYDQNDSNQHISIEEYMETTEPVPEELIRIPDEFVVQVGATEPTEYVKDGEISRMLRNTPNILPPVECFGKNYKPPKPLVQPDVIMTDTIPIFLHSKYFQFPKEDSDESSTVYGKKSWTTFSDSEEDNSKVSTELMRRCQIAEGEPKVTNTKQQKPEQKYYNPREIYMMKRGNKNWNTFFSKSIKWRRKSDNVMPITVVNKGKQKFSLNKKNNN